MAAARESVLRRRRASRRARLHPHLAGAVRAVVVGRRARAAARADLPAAVVPAEHLRLRLLGAPDDRRAHDRPRRSAPSARCRSASTSCAPGVRCSRDRGRSAAGAAAVARQRSCHPYERRPAETAAAPGDGTGRALDRRAPGGRRLVGRHPAAVGVLAHGAVGARLRVDHPVDARRARGHRAVPDRRGRRAAPRGVPVAGLGHGAGDRSRSPTRASRPTTRRSCAPPTGCSTRRSAVTGDWAVRRPDLAPGRLGVRVRERQLPRHRRHRRGRPGAAPGPPSAARARRGRRSAAASTGRSACRAANGGWGAFDADNVRELCRDLPFCDFGEVIDEPSADVTAHVARDARGRGPAGRDRRPRRASRSCSSEQEAGGSWFGRWGVNHVYGTGAAIPGARRLRRSAERPAAAPRGCAGSSASRTRTAAGARTPAPTTTRRGSAAAPSTASQTAWALIALHALGERTEAVKRGLSLARSRPAGGRHLGRARSTRARASRATSTSTTTSTG